MNRAQRRLAQKKAKKNDRELEDITSRLLRANSVEGINALVNKAESIVPGSGKNALNNMNVIIDDLIDPNVY